MVVVSVDEIVSERRARRTKTKDDVMDVVKDIIFPEKAKAKARKPTKAKEGTGGGGGAHHPRRRPPVAEDAGDVQEESYNL